MRILVQYWSQNAQIASRFKKTEVSARWYRKDRLERGDQRGTDSLLDEGVNGEKLGAPVVF
jgi:hypothetical protein